MFSAHNKNVHTRPNRVPEFNYMLYPISLDETKKKKKKNHYTHTKASW